MEDMGLKNSKKHEGISFQSSVLKFVIKAVDKGQITNARN